MRKFLRIWQRQRQRQRYRHMAEAILARVRVGFEFVKSPRLISAGRCLGVNIIYVAVTTYFFIFVFIVELSEEMPGRMIHFELVLSIFG